MKVHRSSPPQPSGDGALEGYLSDVPTIGSNNGSEVSHDLISQTKVLERHFRDKYHLLREAYDQRIRELGLVIHNACKSLLSDEVIAEMKADPTSSPFIPIHIQEILDKYLDNERERYLHQVLQEKANIEVDLGRFKQGYQRVRADFQKAQEIWKEEHREYESRINALTIKSKEKISECEKLQKLIDQKSYEVNVWEQSFQQSARELAIIENIDHESQRHQKDLQDQFVKMTKQRNQLYDENRDVRAEMAILREENERLVKALEGCRAEEEQTKRRVQEMMKEVDQILAQEAQETNSAISSVNEKMKSFRNRLVGDLNKEKRLTQSLQEELSKLRSIKESTFFDQRRFLEEEAAWKEKLRNEQERCQHLQGLVQTLTSQHQEGKVHIQRLEEKYRSLVERMEEEAGQHRREKKLLIEKTRAEAMREAERAVRREDVRREENQLQHLFHLENEVQSLTQTLRQSLTALPTASQAVTTAPAVIAAPPGAPLPASSLDTRQWKEFGRLEAEIEHQKAIMTLQSQRDKVLGERDDLQHHNERLQEDLEKWQRRYEENQRLIATMNERGMGVLGESQRLKEMLKAASATIDKLKAMVASEKEEVGARKAEIDKLNKTISELQLEMTRGKVDREEIGAQLEDALTEAKRWREVAENAQRVAEEENARRKRSASLLAAATTLLPPTTSAAASVPAMTSPMTPTTNFPMQSPTVPASVHMQVMHPAPVAAPTMSAPRTPADLSTTRLVGLHDEEVFASPTPAANIAFSSSSTTMAQSKMLLEAQAETERLKHRVMELEAKSAELETALLASERIAMAAQQASQQIAPAVTKSSAYAEVQTVCPMRDVAVNTSEPHSQQLVDTTDEVQRLRLENSLMSSQLTHYSQHHARLQAEYDSSQVRLFEKSHRCAELETAVRAIHATYRPVLHSLRLELRQLKAGLTDFQTSCDDLATMTRHRCETAVRRLLADQTAVFQRKLQNLKGQLGSAHARELTILEEKFVDQINALNRAHSAELAKMHAEVLQRAEKVVSGNGSNGWEVAEVQAMGSAAVTPLLPAASSGTGVMAFESALRGTLQALSDAEVVGSEVVAQVQAVARSHRDPSLAAATATRAVVAEEIDRFVLRLLSPSQSSTETTAAAELTLQN